MKRIYANCHFCGEPEGKAMFDEEFLDRKVEGRWVKLHYKCWAANMLAPKLRAVEDSEE